MLTFESPQTGSIYKVVASLEGILICYRQVEEEEYRVRIQGTPTELKKINADLEWGNIKAGDHLSVVVEPSELPETLANAVKAVAQHVL